MVTSHCQNCESPVSHAFVRVYGKNGRVRVCPECEIWDFKSIVDCSRA